jgi:hypothetical protein
MTFAYVGAEHSIFLFDIAWPADGWQGPSFFVADIDDADIDVTNADELTGAAYDQLLLVHEQPSNTAVCGFNWIECRVIDGFMQFRHGDAEV